MSPCKADIQNEKSLGQSFSLAIELGQSFAIRATDATGEPSPFSCRICTKHVSELTHGPHEILQLFQGSKLFPRDQRPRLETPGWRVLDYKENLMTDGEFEWQQEWILRAPKVDRDKEYRFSEGIIVNCFGTVDVSFPKVWALVETLSLDGSYELVCQLWAPFTLIAGHVNVDVTRSRGEALVSVLLASSFYVSVQVHSWLFSF